MDRISPRSLKKIGIECKPSERNGYLGERFSSREKDPTCCGSKYGFNGNVSVFKFHKQWMLFILADEHEEYHPVNYIEEVIKWINFAKDNLGLTFETPQKYK